MRRHRHPDRTIGDPAPLVAGAGVLPPLMVRDNTGRLVLMGGELRLRALQAGGAIKVRVHVARDWPALAGWLILDARSDGRTSMLRSEVGAFTLKAVRYLNLNALETSQLDGMIGDAYDYTSETVRASRWLQARAADLPAGQLRDAVLADSDLVDAGLLRASSAVSRAGRRKAEAERRNGAAPAAEQRKVFKRSIPALAGTVEALVGLGPISAELTAAERAAWEKALRAAQTHLTRITRDLKQSRENDK